MQNNPFDRSFHSADAFELDELLQRLSDEKGIQGLAEYAQHLIAVIRETGLDLGRYEGPVEAVSRWLDDRPVLYRTESEDGKRFREGLQRGAGAAACIGLSKCHDPHAAIHFVCLHLLRGLDLDELLQASKHVGKYFWLLSEREESQEHGRPSDQTELLLKAWILDRE